MTTRLDKIHERDGQQDERTDRHRMTAEAALMHSIARQKFTKNCTEWRIILCLAGIHQGQHCNAV